MARSRGGYNPCTVAVTVWQQLGGMVQTLENLSSWHLDRFTEVGGRWVAPVIYNDEHSGPTNLALLSDLQRRANARGLRVGGWFNGRGYWDTEADADRIASLAKLYGLNPVILDLELEYKHPEGHAYLMPLLLKAVRKRLPLPVEIGVSSYGWADRGMIWSDPMQSYSLWRLAIRFMPQWYYRYDGRYAPQWCMKDLKERGHLDENVRDPKNPYGRGIPLSFAHGSVSCVEGHDLAEGLRLLKLAQELYGFTWGFNAYTLENCWSREFDLLRAQRNKLFLV